MQSGEFIGTYYVSGVPVCALRSDGDTSSFGKHKLAVYDFDGTCISGNSPVMLVRYLIRRRKLDPWAAMRIGFWAIAYKLKLPQNESWVRWLVFKPFEGITKEEVDDYLAQFYEDVVSKRYRAEADESMRRMSEEGCLVVVVSATWQAIVDQAQKSHPFDVGICTCMQVDNLGNYTRLVDGLPVEGMEKVRAVKRFADERFGRGNWVLEYAYGDHHSDLPLLERAKHPCAVTPDNPLERQAKRRNWKILDWKKPRVDLDV